MRLRQALHGGGQLAQARGTSVPGAQLQQAYAPLQRAVDAGEERAGIVVRLGADHHAAGHAQRGRDRTIGRRHCDGDAAPSIPTQRSAWPSRPRGSPRQRATSHASSSTRAARVAPRHADQRFGRLDLDAEFLVQLARQCRRRDPPRARACRREIPTCRPARRPAAAAPAARVPRRRAARRPSHGSGVPGAGSSAGRSRKRNARQGGGRFAGSEAPGSTQARRRGTACTSCRSRRGTDRCGRPCGRRASRCRRAAGLGARRRPPRRPRSSAP